MTRSGLLRGALVGAVVLVAGTALGPAADGSTPWLLHVVAGVALATAAVLSRAKPAAGVAVLVLVEATAALAGIPLHANAIAVAVVVYHCARYGGRGVLWVSAVVVPAAYLLFGAFLSTAGTDAAQRIARAGLTRDPVAFALLLVTMSAPLALPWLLGLSLRWRESAERGRHALVVAQAEAAAREQQAQLAREVHDVVGHSLALILRQADSVAYLDGGTPPAVLEVVGTIAAEARASLTEVRHVLSSGGTAPTVSDLDELVSRIPPTVATVDDDVLGDPRPLPPDLALVAHRVLQEMLTNALKHGTGGRIEVVRDWRDGLRLVVGNPAAHRRVGSGMGLSGMRQRVEAVGGSLSVDAGRERFTVEARIPLRETVRA